MKRAFIIHGWGGTPHQHWLPWLAAELQKQEFEVHVPTMPDTDHPDTDRWLATLEREVGSPDQDTYLIGHSIGCLTILRYLERHGPIGGTVLVAPWVILSPESVADPADARIAEDWTASDMNWGMVKAGCRQFTAIFSDDDPDVPLQENKPVFENELGANIIVESGKGHFTAEDDVTELPSALQAVLDMSR